MPCRHACGPLAMSASQGETMARRVATLFVLMSGVGVLAACGPVKKTPPQPQPVHGTMTFNCTGGPQSFQVGFGITSVMVDAYGAQGGTGAGTNGAPGGLGGRATATVPVTPGEALEVNVGCQGANAAGATAGAGGFNAGIAGDGTGGSGGGVAGGGGGGGSDVRSEERRVGKE